MQRQEYAREAEKLGIEVTDGQITKKLEEVKKQYFSGNQAKFEKGLKDQGYTVDTLRDDIRSQLVTEGIYKKVTNDVKVTDADLKSYYEQNRSKYSVPESRSVRHILVKTKAEADAIHSQLQNGGDFAAIAKESSADPGSKDSGGKLTITRGQTVPEFDKSAFELSTNEISKPVKTTYGYHIIEPLSDTKKATVQPLDKVKASIKTSLLQQKRNDAIQAWVEDQKKDYEGKVSYAAGYEPPQLPEAPTETQ